MDEDKLSVRRQAESWVELVELLDEIAPNWHEKYKRSVDGVLITIAELSIDAKRYRWLRDKNDSGDNEWFVYASSGDKLDNDIDKAMLDN